jgi:hypothetical protein
VEGWIITGGERWSMVPFLPGTRTIAIDLPGESKPRCHFIGAIPVTIEPVAGSGQAPAGKP